MVDYEIFDYDSFNNFCHLDYLGLYSCFNKIIRQVEYTTKEAKTDYIGGIGEKRTKVIISRIEECEYILTNVYLPAAKGGKTEIDLIAFTNRGLLVLETKNCCGIIHGDVDSEYWASEVQCKNNYFYNPLKQNANHVKYLDKAIGLNVPIYSIIVFSDRSSLVYLPNSFQDVYICKMSTLIKTIKEIFNENPACISSIMLNNIYHRIEKYANPNEEVIRKHKEYVRSKSNELTRMIL